MNTFHVSGKALDLVDAYPEGCELKMHHDMTIRLESEAGKAILVNVLYIRPCAEDGKMIYKVRTLRTEPKRILSAGTMMRWLLEHRYKPDEYGTWISPDIGLDFLPAMWAYCGGTDTGGYKWLPEWFEGEK